MMDAHEGRFPNICSCRVEYGGSEGKFEEKVAPRELRADRGNGPLLFPTYDPPIS